MTTKQPILQRLPLLLATGLLSTGLLLSGCSNNDSDDTQATADSEDTAAAVDTSDDVTLNDDMADQVENTDSPSETGEVADAAEDNAATDLTEQKSLVTNPTQAGTPEDTVKQALNSLYYSDVKDAVAYYQVDMANFEAELANTQSAFQQTVEGVTITDTTYNDDKTRATITGELMLKGQSEPAPLTYQLQKIKGQWKILG